MILIIGYGNPLRSDDSIGGKMAASIAPLPRAIQKVKGLIKELAKAGE